MFGSLVIVFPTHHEGGALFLQHHSYEWIFEPSQALAFQPLDRRSIGYAAFLSDVKQDVAPVISGHCVTLTYNLCFDDNGGPVSEKDTVSEHLIPPKLPNQDGFCEAFKVLLENPEFMADGGTLAFGLRHGYPVEYNLKPVYDVLKGSDTVVYQSMRALGFEPKLYMYYGNLTFNPHEGVIVGKVVGFHNVFLDKEEESVRKVLLAEGAILVRQDGGKLRTHPYNDHFDSFEKHEPME